MSGVLGWILGGLREWFEEFRVYLSMGKQIPLGERALELATLFSIREWHQPLTRAFEIASQYQTDHTDGRRRRWIHKISDDFLS